MSFLCEIKCGMKNSKQKKNEKTKKTFDKRNVHSFFDIETCLSPDTTCGYQCNFRNTAESPRFRR